MSTHNLCFEQQYEKYLNFLSESFPFLVVKFSIYLNWHVFIMMCTQMRTQSAFASMQSSQFLLST